MLEQQICDGRKDEGSKARSTHCDACCKSSPFFEVVPDRNDGRQINQAESDSTDDSVSNHEHGNRIGKCAQYECQAAYHATQDACGPRAEFVCQSTDDWTCNEINNCSLIPLTKL